MSPALASSVRPPLAYVLAISLVAAMGGLLFGYDWVVIGGAKPFYEKFFHLATAASQGWAMSCALVGCLGGAALSGPLAEAHGRKRILLGSAVLFGVSSLGTGLADSFGAFVAWRMVGGVAIGLASSLSPLYIAEIAPARIRGLLVSLNQLTIVVGILAAQVVNWRIAEPVPAGATAAEILASWNGQSGWRWMFGVTAVPSVLFLLGACFVPESPRWLARRGDPERARAVLTRIGGPAHADLEMTRIEATLGEGEAGLRPLLDPKLRKVLGLGLFLAVFQQWCGINVIFNYAEEVFAAAGYQVSGILFNIVITGIVNLLFTFVAMRTVDAWGRRGLMLTGAGGLACLYILLGACFRFGVQGLPVIVLVMAAIACYAMSLAPVTWVLISEIFPNRVRGAAMSAAVFVLWGSCFLLTYTFPLLNRALGASGTFWTYGLVCVLGFLFLRGALGETKGRSLEELESDLAAAPARPAAVPNA